MDVDLQQAHQFNLIAVGYGLTCYKSAPCSFFSSFVMDYKDVSDFLRSPPPNPLSPQFDRIFAQLAPEISDNRTLVVEATTPVIKHEIEKPELSLEPAPAMMASYTPNAALPPPNPLSSTSSGVGAFYGGLKPSASPLLVRILVGEKQSSDSNLTRLKPLTPPPSFSSLPPHNLQTPKNAATSPTPTLTTSSAKDSTASDEDSHD